MKGFFKKVLVINLSASSFYRKDQVGDDAPEFVHNRVAMQDEHMEEIWKIFGERVRAVIPLFETEVKGTHMLNRMIDYLFVP